MKITKDTLIQLIKEELAELQEQRTDRKIPVDPRNKPTQGQIAGEKEDTEASWAQAIANDPEGRDAIDFARRMGRAQGAKDTQRAIRAAEKKAANVDLATIKRPGESTKGFLRRRTSELGVPASIQADIAANKWQEADKALMAHAREKYDKEAYAQDPVATQKGLDDLSQLMIILRTLVKKTVPRAAGVRPGVTQGPVPGRFRGAVKTNENRVPNADMLEEIIFEEFEAVLAEGAVERAKERTQKVSVWKTFCGNTTIENYPTSEDGEPRDPSDIPDSLGKCAAIARAVYKTLKRKEREVKR